MKLHEYQAKEIFGSFGIPIPSGKVATSAEEANSNENSNVHFVESNPMLISTDTPCAEQGTTCHKNPVAA